MINLTNALDRQLDPGNLQISLNGILTQKVFCLRTFSTYMTKLIFMVILVTQMTKSNKTSSNSLFVIYIKISIRESKRGCVVSIIQQSYLFRSFKEPGEIRH